MVKHIVLFKLKPGVTRDDPRAQEAAAALAAVGKHVPGVAQWEYGWNFTDRPIAYDFGLYSGFNDREALAAYLPHPKHQGAVALWKEIADWNICDFEFGR